MKFDWVNLKYIAWFLIGILTLFGIYTLLCELGLEKHKFWAFLLALLLAALLLWLIWYLMNEGMPLDGIGRISDVFARFGKKGKATEREPLATGPPIGGEEETNSGDRKCFLETRGIMLLCIEMRISFLSHVSGKPCG